MSIDEEEIRDYLENKSLKKNLTPTLANDVNYYDQGGDAKEEKIGQKSSLSRNLYLMERNKKIQFGDKQAIAEYITEQTTRNEEIKNRVEQSRLEWELNREEEQLKKKLSKITQADRDKEAEDIEKLVRKRDREISNIQDYFNASQEEWEEYQNNRHTSDESPAGALITQADNGTWACDIHRYQKVLESPTNDGRLIASTFTLQPVEQHFRQDPKPHLDALIEIVNTKYDKLVQARREKTLEDPEIRFRKEVRHIESIPSRTDGDMRVTKLTKGQKARLREAEEAQNEENRRIYRGLY